MFNKINTSELLQTRIRQLLPDGWYRMRSVDKFGKLSKGHYDVKVIRAEDNKDKGVLLCEDNKGRKHLTDNWECTYDSFRDYKLGFYDSFDGNQSFFETVVDETMTTLECKEVDGGKIVGIGLLLHEEGNEGNDYVCEGFDLCRASRTNADKFFFHPIEVLFFLVFTYYLLYAIIKCCSTITQ